MSISRVEANRRADLRAAALFVVDDERRATGYDKRVAGSADVPDVVRAFDEYLATFPLESEVGGAIRSVELSSWRAVLTAMGPVWALWPTFSADPRRLLATPEWAQLRVVVGDCVRRHGLWREEVRFPVRIGSGAGGPAYDDWATVDRLDPALLDVSRTEDADGRVLEFEPGGARPSARRSPAAVPRPCCPVSRRRAARADSLSVATSQAERRTPEQIIEPSGGTDDRLNSVLGLP